MLTRWPARKVNADLTPASCFLLILVKALVSTHLSIFVVFLLGDFFAVNCHSRMLNARHPLGFVTRFKQIVRADCELNFSAVTVTAMTSMTHYHIELHLNCSLRSFCIYYNRLVSGCQVKIMLFISSFIFLFKIEKMQNTIE